MSAANQRLDSWKAIAAYLGRDVRTARRWEQELGLPVHRIQGGTSRSVFAHTNEIDRWLTTSGGDSTAPAATAPVRRPGVRRRSWIGAAVLVAVASAGITLVRTRPASIATVRVEERTLRAFDASGALRWSYPLPGRIATAREPRRWSPLVDLDGDGHDDLVAGFASFDPGFELEREHLIAFSPSGRVLWQRVADERATFGGHEYAGPWPAADLLAFGGPQPRIAWALHHYTWWPSLLLVINARGETVGRFAHPGWLTSLAITVDGRWLLAGGRNNARDRAAVAVLDAADANGSAPPVGAEFDCADCSPRRPLRYLLFAPSELSRAALSRPDHPVDIKELGNRSIEIHLMQNTAGTAEAIVELDGSLCPVRARFSDTYWTWHRQLEAEGRIDHPADQCPDRAGIEFEMWTAAEGWRTQFATSK